jgi:hypothetical protein
MIFSDLASPAEAGFAKAGNRYAPTDQVRGQAFRDHALTLLAILVLVRAGFGLAVHPGEQRGSFGAFLLVLVLLRFFLFFVASHLTLCHGDLQILDG